ncbi:MAG: hypothetical protein DRJ51_00440 [Thermoprotei archaeon]|nr:MAG: hypothetical protein DRJ51_00440 [Thermoprotei archaeon]RLE99935.1 MAG: hypothetical protein DRJ59_07595 [Thermoprotei archaeon]
MLTERIEVRVRIGKREKVMKVKRAVKVISILRDLNINPVEVVVLKDGVPVTEEEVLVKDTCIEIISVVSGG